MKKKILLCLLLAAAMLLPMLSSCMMTGGDALELEKVIITENAVDPTTGRPSTLVEFHYFEDESAKQVFYIPNGEIGTQGAQGAQGMQGPNP